MGITASLAAFSLSSTRQAGHPNLNQLLDDHFCSCIIEAACTCIIL